MTVRLSLFRFFFDGKHTRLRPSFVPLRALYEAEIAEVVLFQAPERSSLHGEFLMVNRV